MSLKIKEEVKKQFDAGFLAVARYPEWVANIVLVPKKDEKVRMCADYQNLNRANPKDNFPLLHIDVLVDNNQFRFVFLHERVLGLQSDKDGVGGHGEDYVRHPLGNVLLQGDVLWAQECEGNLSAGYGSIIP